MVLYCSKLRGAFSVDAMRENCNTVMSDFEVSLPVHPPCPLPPSVCCPSAYSQAEVCELWNAAVSHSSSDIMPGLSDSGHHAGHPQSRGVRVAHVFCVCVMRVRLKWLKLQRQSYLGKIKWQLPMCHFRLAGCCLDAAWFRSLWNILRMPITLVLTVTGSSTYTEGRAANEHTWARNHQQINHQQNCKLTLAVKCITISELVQIT